MNPEGMSEDAKKMLRAFVSQLAKEAVLPINARRESINRALTDAAYKMAEMHVVLAMGDEQYYRVEQTVDGHTCVIRCHVTKGGSKSSDSI